MRNSEAPNISAEFATALREKELQGWYVRGYLLHHDNGRRCAIDTDCEISAVVSQDDAEMIEEARGLAEDARNVIADGIALRARAETLWRNSRKAEKWLIFATALNLTCAGWNMWRAFNAGF